MKEKEGHDVPEIPFHTPGEKEEWYKYICQKCGIEDEAPAFVVEEFGMDQELKEGEKAGVACPKCNEKMKFQYAFKK